MSQGYNNNPRKKTIDLDPLEYEYNEPGGALRRKRQKPSKEKLPATVEEQLAKLKERGCTVEDEEYAIYTLTNINYFRLAHYFSLYLTEEGKYREGTRFKDVMQVYDFDRKLRSLLMGALEQIEIALRAHCSNYHAIKYGATGYLSGQNFSHVHNHKTFLSRINRLIEANEDSQMVQHYLKKHGGQFPLWVIMELFSFGGLNMFYSDLKPQDKMDIAKKYYKTSSGDLENKLRKMTELRNHCAHYHRLYDWEIGDIHSAEGSVFDYILIMKELYNNGGKFREDFIRPFRRLYFDYTNEVDLSMLGFPENWLDVLLEGIASNSLIKAENNT